MSSDKRREKLSVPGGENNGKVDKYEVGVEVKEEWEAEGCMSVY